MSYKVSVILEKDDSGYYIFCPELKGCHSQGDTVEEALANIREAIDLYIETLDDEEKRTLLSREILTTSLEVKVA
ncbi:MAG: type II toxin-antitoxin system HicB family antitoxin [Candidatus Wallbacteria bacterium]|nr:type II toxin-antitoxin system HicB family antitoxin [Candidatus Wallbacteria bacterium]